MNHFLLGAIQKQGAVLEDGPFLGALGAADQLAASGQDLPRCSLAEARSPFQRPVLPPVHQLRRDPHSPEPGRQSPVHGPVGRPRLPQDVDGRVFDWRDVTRNLFEVKLSAQRPANGAVTARYRGQWFYIDDTDLDSKSTFSLLAQLFALQSGKTPKVGPVLTLPVGG